MAPELTDTERDLLKEVDSAFNVSEEYLKPFHRQANERYARYRSYQGLQEAHRKASPPDRDTLLRDSTRDWGATLTIPYAFSTVETILPRAVSNRPRGLILPAEAAAEQNVENMRRLIDYQQDQISYELVLQDTAKSGFIYGLGVQKDYWHTEYRTAPKLERAINADQAGGAWVVGEPQKQPSHDGPMVDDVDIFDFFWDPYGHDMRTVSYVIHRTWRSAAYVLDMLDGGRWNTEAARELEPEHIRSMGAGGKYDEAWKDRMEAAGHSSWQSRSTGDLRELHEVWEFHDRKRVITVLDRMVPVQVGDNPAWHGELPFSIYRPTTAGTKQLMGIGEIEPLAHLLSEMDTLRSQRRDNATVKLQQPFAFNYSLIEPDNLKIGPGLGIPVNGEPRDALYPIQMGDIPNSGYQEEANLQADIERTVGISDPVTGSEGGGAAQTATGAQLVQAAANVRIQNKTRRLEVETVKPTMRRFVALNQQMIVGQKQVRVPRDPQPGETSGPFWEFLELSPAELAGQFEFVVEGGSMAPKNIPEQRQNGLQTYQSFAQNPLVDQQRLTLWALEQMGITSPQAWLRPPEPQVPMRVMESVLAQYEQVGGDANALREVVAQAIEADEQQQAEPASAGQNGGPPQ